MEPYVIPYADPITGEIDLYRRSWEDLMRQRIRFSNRGTDAETGEIRSQYMVDLAEIIGVSEEKVHRQLGKLLRSHPMGDWLVEAKTCGARVAIILATIRNPHRFPSQKCNQGCHLLPTFNVGDPCPCWTTAEVGEKAQPCDGIIQERRHGTGCRSLWHMMALYPIPSKNGDGPSLARRQKGEQSSFNQKAKTAILMPQGIAQQFYMQGSRYADVYYEAKERLAADPKNADKAPGWLDTTARVIAAKKWVGDLLIEWKRITPIEEDAN